MGLGKAVSRAFCVLLPRRRVSLAPSRSVKRGRSFFLSTLQAMKYWFQKSPFHPAREALYGDLPGRRRRQILEGW
jgi:hypothetical protein